MDIAEDHRSLKHIPYWTNLVKGETALYKAAAIDALLAKHFASSCSAILDIGCGTSVIARSLRSRLRAKRLVFMDYDADVVAEMRSQTDDPTIEWIVDDIFKIGSWQDRFDLIILLDMIHEVYSFYGRPVRKMEAEIDHALGQDAVKRALAQVAKLVTPAGGIIITDNVLSPDNGTVVIKPRHALALATVKRFLKEYPSRGISVTWCDETSFRINTHDLNILLTQYNKLKSGKIDRWNVERFEIHQYMTESELRECFANLGFTMHAIVGTPESAAAEWNEDFAVIDGAASLPDKRITLLAIKNS